MDLSFPAPLHYTHRYAQQCWSWRCSREVLVQRSLQKANARPLATTIQPERESCGLVRSQSRRLSHTGGASNLLKGICSRASDILQGLEPPYRKVSDLAHRNGDKVAVCTAATCRFLLEAPPLNRVDREGGRHMKSYVAFYMLNFRKFRSYRSPLCSDIPNSSGENGPTALRS